MIKPVNSPVKVHRLNKISTTRRFCVFNKLMITTDYVNSK